MTSSPAGSLPAVESRPPDPSSYVAVEREFLRWEMRQIRADQARYLALSAALTVAASVVMAAVGAVVPIAEASFLIPLLIVLPSWWLFFDRACSMSRIVGYLRILDEIDGPERAVPRFRFEGWERCLTRFRDLQSLDTPSGPRRWRRAYGLALADALLLRGPQRGLAIHWYAFAVLAAFSLAWAYPGRPVALGYLLSFGTVAVSGLYNLYLLGDLTAGRRSYDGNEVMWSRVLWRSVDREVGAGTEGGG